LAGRVEKSWASPDLRPGSPDLATQKMGPNTESPNKYTESLNILEDMSIGVSSFLPILIISGKKRLYGKNRSSLLSYFREN
jgi:hypothetical protein